MASGIPDFAPSRRHLLGGLAAAALAPRAAFCAPSAAPTLRALLDRAAAEAEPGRGLEVLLGVDPNVLGAADGAIWRMVTGGMEREEKLRQTFRYGKPDGSSPYVLSQRHGAWLEATGAKPGLAARLDQETARLTADAAAGIAPPAFIVEAVVQGQRDSMGLAPDVAAALERQTAAITALRTRPGAGVGRLPGGAAYYAARLGCTTGTDISPVLLDARISAETKALLVRADALLKRLGLARGSVGARLRNLKARPDQIYAPDDAGRNRAVADMNAALERLRPRLPLWFNPPVETNAVVRRMSSGDELARRRGYREPPAYFPDLAAVEDRPGWTLTTVAYHETIPGHVLQLRRQSAADPHPLQIRYAPGYSEGWAIYAESLADRIGLLTPIQQLGMLQSLLFRLARVSADIGIHVHGWQRERAVRYLEETVGFELFFPFAVEVDRYCVEPAGFAGDALVAVELRRRAARLTPVEATHFHDLVLNRGPLSVEALATLA